MTSLADLQAGQTPDPTGYEVRQLVGGGVLGQGLKGQERAMEAAERGVAPTTAQTQPGTPVQAQPSQQAAQPSIRPWAFTHLNPNDWTPAEHAYFQQQHNIQGAPPQQRPGGINMATIVQMLHGLMGGATGPGMTGQTPAAAGGQQLPQPGIPQL